MNYVICYIIYLYIYWGFIVFYNIIYIFFLGKKKEEEGGEKMEFKV